jgi:hypothetical protein
MEIGAVSLHQQTNTNRRKAQKLKVMKPLKKEYRDEILKKDGSIKSIYRKTITDIFVGTKVYPKRWAGSGSHISLSNRWDYCINLIKGLGYTYKVGNDAPRGGVEGDYIKISKVALQAIKYLLK